MKYGYLIGIIVFGLVLAGCIATPPELPPVCEDKTCFIAAANDCASERITINESFGTVDYISRGCKLTKRIVSLDSSETQEMKDLVEGKSMVCAYKKGEFDRELMDSLLMGIETCEGDLKDIFVDLLIFA